MSGEQHGRIATVIAATAAVWVVGAIALERYLTVAGQRVGYWNHVGQALPVPLVVAAALSNLLERRRLKKPS